MDKTAFLQHRNNLLPTMPDICRHVSSFRSINRRWEGAVTAGMIETGRMQGEAGRLFAPLIEDMGSTKQNYSEMQSRLIDAILFEMAKKVVLELTDAAKFTINILKRNLFERTADVGYLATDAEIVDFLKQGYADKPGNGPGSIAERAPEIRKRLADYRFEYTVYDEIIILDVHGRVCVTLDPSNPVTRSSDPMLARALAMDLHDGSDAYVETFRPTDLRPGKGNTLVYAQKIEDPETRAPLGTLCLCFDFKDEMDRIFKDLHQGNQQMVVAILDEHGHVMSTSNESLLPPTGTVSVDLESDFRILNFGGKSFLVSTVATDGYQDFYGLTWYGTAMIEARTAFSTGTNGNGRLDRSVLSKLQNFSSELTSIKSTSDDLLADMKLDSINGQVKAAKFDADGFVEVLRFVDWIGDEIDSLFSEAIDNLQQTVVTSLFHDVEFRSFQGNNIADRNLYERANDVCWWALTPLFRSLLAKHAAQGLNDTERQALMDNLQYINDLYTPYLRLVLADAKGTVVAVSEPPDELEERFVRDGLPQGREFIGMQLDAELVRKTAALSSAKEYCVSEFAATPLYGGRPTYIYSTAVRDPEDAHRIVGAIQIVFDSEPQFAAMLEDVLPRDEKKEVLENSFAVFTDRKKHIISSTSKSYPTGTLLPLEDTFFKKENGSRSSAVVDLDGRSYAVGIQVSHGYREYKRDDAYTNDVVCLIFVPI